MDLSKVFDCIPHDLITKLAAYGFGQYSILLIHLSNRKQRVKFGSEFSDWLQIKSGVPQGSVLGPLFSISSLMICFLQLKSRKFVMLWTTLQYIQIGKILKV